MDYALKKTLLDDVGFIVRTQNCSRHLTINIGGLAYADDICFLAKSIVFVKCSHNRIKHWDAEIGLPINNDQTKASYLGQASIRYVHSAIGVPVDSCDKLENLWVHSSNADSVL